MTFYGTVYIQCCQCSEIVQITKMCTTPTVTCVICGGTWLIKPPKKINRICMIIAMHRAFNKDNMHVYIWSTYPTNIIKACICVYSVTKPVAQWTPCPHHPYQYLPMFGSGAPMEKKERKKREEKERKKNVKVMSIPRFHSVWSVILLINRTENSEKDIV